MVKIDAGYLPKRSLREVHIPASVVKISDDAFAAYDVLEKVTFANGSRL